MTRLAQSGHADSASECPLSAAQWRLRAFGAAFAAARQTLLRWRRQSLEADQIMAQLMADVTDEVPISHLQRRLTRTQTVMEGASHCDFRFAKKT